MRYKILIKLEYDVGLFNKTLHFMEATEQNIWQKLIDHIWQTSKLTQSLEYQTTLWTYK